MLLQSRYLLQGLGVACPTIWGLNQLEFKSKEISLGLFRKALRRAIVFSQHDTKHAQQSTGCIMTSFSIITAVSEQQAGTSAETVANVEVYPQILDVIPSISLNSPLVLERFRTTSLFRIVALSNTFPLRNQMVLCLPTDCAWGVSQLRKIRSTRSGKKAIQFDVLTPVGHKEGFDRLVITIPYDGEDGNAVLYYQALLFASQEVRRHIEGV